MLRLEKRRNVSRAWTVTTPLIAVFLTMLFGGLMFGLLLDGFASAFSSIKLIFWDPLFDENFASYARPQLLVKAGPIILIAIGLSIGFKAGIWNIGAEGQYILGAIFGASVALSFYPQESIFIFPAMVLAGAVGGFIWGLIPALLKVYFKTNEILVSLMLVYVAENILASVSQGLLRNPEGMGFPGSRNFQEYPSAFNEEIITNSGMHWGVITAFISVILAYFLFLKHQKGYEIRISGEAPKAAYFAGINPSKTIIFCLGTSGLLAGMAGLFEVAGPAGQITISFNSGYGFTAIIVAFLGRLNPIGILLAGLLMALTYIGGELAQLMLGLPGASIQLLQGMLLFFLLATDIFTNYKLKFRSL